MSTAKEVQRIFDELEIKRPSKQLRQLMECAYATGHGKGVAKGLEEAKGVMDKTLKGGKG
jgi:hypothetical protein